jgi:hypothetical protein
MRKKVLGFAITAALASYAQVSSATTINEEEINNSITTAQALPSAQAYSIKGSIGKLGDTSSNQDLDYYTFQANAGDVLNLDIDNGSGGAGSINTIIGIFDENGTLLRMNDNATLDEGSTSIEDSRIDAFTAPKTGAYTVAVSTFPRYFNDDGSVSGGTFGFFSGADKPGDYTLNISGITLRVKQINMEVKPGVKGLAPLKPSSKGKIPVAILGSSSFDVSTINEESLTFGASGKEKSLDKCQKVSNDFNNDGYGDLLCHFENSKAGFKSGDLEAVLTGETKAKQKFEARALLKVIPTQKK